MKDSRIPPGKDGARAEREQRLAEALRANLKRRKSAARTRTSGQSDDTNDGAPKAGNSAEKRR